MYLTTRGLVIRVTKYNDTDALLTLLSHNDGKLTVKARGLFRKNSPLTAPCQLLAYSEFILFEYKDQYTINEAQTIELFRGLRRDLSKLSLGSYFAQVAQILSQEDLPNPELLSLVLNCLYALDKLDLPENLVKAVFELRAACLSGYEPELHGCAKCGNSVPDRFHIFGGHLECAACRDHSDSGLRIPITAGTLDSMRYICSCDPKQLFSFQVGESTAENLSQISEAYLSAQLEQGFSALDFYKSLQM